MVTDMLFLSRERHSSNYCAMYDICGQRSDGKVLNCPYGSEAVKVGLICFRNGSLSIPYFSVLLSYRAGHDVGVGMG